tara:strand:- start:84 stop:515 length:432 start_codon:yes stop_codon:yes gene_type:complete
MSIILPRPILPKNLDIPQMYLRQPTADVPAFRPIVIPPSDLERPEGTQRAEEKTTEAPASPKLEIPIIDIQMPLPTAEVMVTAVTAALGAVATTTLAQPLFEQIKKFVTKQLNKRIETWKKKQKEKTSLIKSKENEESSKKNK